MQTTTRVNGPTLPDATACGKLARCFCWPTHLTIHAAVPSPALRLSPLLFSAVFMLPPSAMADDAVLATATAGPLCPVGILQCSGTLPAWSLCKRNALMDFYDPTLPTTGVRNGAPMDVEGEVAESGDGNHYVLQGGARIQQLDQLIRADRFDYMRDSTKWIADGNIQYQDRSMLLSADHGEGTTTPSVSALDGVRYQLLTSRGNGVAARAVLPDADHADLTGASFTTCDIGDPQWEFRAREMHLDQATGIGRARDVTFRFGDVPILWVPFARFPLDDRRVSGFLYPEAGYSDRRGFDLTLPYYLNLAPNYDATLIPRLLTERGLLLGGEFRYLTNSSVGKLNFTYLPNDDKTGSDRGLFHLDNRTTLSQNWGLVADLNNVSDKFYFEDFGRGLNQSAISLLGSRVYLEGRGRWWNASVGGDRYQITDPNIPDSSEPYRRLPRATFEGEHPLFAGFTGGIRSEFVAFSKTDAVEASRGDFYPYIALPLQAAGWFLRPELGYRYTTYEIDRDNNSSPTRGTPIASVDAGLIFERDTSIFGNDFIQTFEPRAYYLRVPYRNQDDLPLFDTFSVPISYGQLFRPNQFVGADRQSDANNLTLALTTRLIEDSSGEDRLSATIGQIRYFDGQRVQLPGVSPTDFDSSAYVGSLDVRLGQRWRLRLDQQYSPNSEQTDLSAVSVQNRFGLDGAVNVSYRFRRDYLEQADISALIPINREWRVVGRHTYSMFDNKALETFVGIERDSCCTAWRVLARRWIRNTLANQNEVDKALYFEIEFKGVGSFGQRTDDFLRRAILGYRQ